MVRKILVCQHVAYEILGTLDPLFRNSGFRIRYVNFDRHPDLKPSLDGYNGLVILGGPMNVDQTKKHPHLLTEIKLIEDALKRGIPILGICLGAQLIAKTLGAHVGKNHQKEIGWYDVNLNAEGHNDPVLRHFQKSEKIFQWHGDSFEIPKTAVHLATSPTCANQAYRYKDNVYGFQFHLEVDNDTIHRWLNVTGNKKELEELGGIIDPQKILEQTPHHITPMKQLSDKTFSEFIKLFGEKKKTIRLTSK